MGETGEGETLGQGDKETRRHRRLARNPLVYPLECSPTQERFVIALYFKPDVEGVGSDDFEDDAEVEEAVIHAGGRMFCEEQFAAAFIPGSSPAI